MPIFIGIFINSRLAIKLQSNYSERDKAGIHSMKILVINGPNMNLLGLREPDIYGKQTYADLVRILQEKAEALGVEISFMQSNHEGALVDAIQEACPQTDGIIINPAGYTFTSVAILDALKAVAIPAVEVHMSDLGKRDAFRQRSYVREVCIANCMGRGFESYLEALDILVWFCSASADTNTKPE